MPPPNGSTKPKKKKKKGRAPAHQNTVAFRHNPKSKKTAHILSLPISGVCGRCREKLEWRKKYRKYKPLTQPATCNVCRRRNVKAAYHTVCRDCSATSDAARALLEHWNRSGAGSAEPDGIANAPVGGAVEPSLDDPSDVPHDSFIDLVEMIDADADAFGGSGMVRGDTAAGGTRGVPSRPYTRVCAVCFKEPAVRGGDDVEEDEEGAIAALGRLKLRELKALERRQQQAQAKPRRRRTADGEGVVAEDDDDDDESASQSDSASESEVDSDVEEDPFLLAVGGADKLVVGEAYQQRILEQERLVQKS